MPLEQYYSGDEAFTRFASTPDPQLDAELEAWPHKVKLIKICGGDALLARAVFHVASAHAIEYMSTPIPGLDGLTPVECLQTYAGQKRLRECLMRTP